MTLNSTAPKDPSNTLIKSDVLIVGAGPAGLFQVFELGLLGIKAHVIDPLPYPGGQCVELYGDKTIYDIPGLPQCTGQELIDRLMLQIKPFDAQFHFQDRLQSLVPLTDRPGFELQSAAGLNFEVKAVVLANGVGAFLPRPLNVPEQEEYLGHHLFHGDLSEALKKHQALGQKSPNSRTKIWVVGGDEEAVKNVLTAHAHWPDLDITLIHRRTHLDISEDLSQALQEALAEHLNRSHEVPGRSTLQFKHGQIVHLFDALHSPKESGAQQDAPPHSALSAEPEPKHKTKNKNLKALQWVDENAQMHTEEVDLVVVNLGLTPQLGPVAEWGAQMLKKQITVNTEDYSTSVPGVFAIGDVITYPGKKKLILSGFHEAALASFGIAKWVLQEERIPFEYTSASALLQSRLGVRS